jgi:hypothetical protein
MLDICSVQSNSDGQVGIYVLGRRTLHSIEISLKRKRRY